MNENIKITFSTNLNSSILSIHKSNNGVSVVTQDYQAALIDIDSGLKVLNKIIHSEKIPHSYSKSSSSSEFHICLCEVESKRASIARIQDDIKPILQITSHKSDISASNFSKSSSLLATGGEDGRVYVFETASFFRILSLPYRPDYISSLNFSSDDRFLFASCFDKSNIIFDCQRAKAVSIFNTNEVVEWGEFFECNGKLFLITRDFKSIIYDVRNNQVLSKENLFNSWPSIACIDESEKIAIVGSRDGSIYLINLATNTLLFHTKIKNIVGISSLCLYLGHIIIGCISGELLVISYNDENEAFKNACDSKNYALASSMLESNVFLSLLPCASVFDIDWEVVLKEAINLLSDDKIEEAIALVKPFLNDINKKNAFDVYLNQKDSLKRFNRLLKDKNFTEAYNMTLQIKFLSKTSQFEELEESWHRAFNSAKKLLEEDSLNLSLAKKYLEPFAKTPKKETINQLLNNLHIFKDADNFIKEQAFAEYFSLTSKFAFLKDGEVYKKVLNLGENIFLKAINAKNTNEYDEFYKLARFLLDFPMYKENVTKLMISVDKKLEMLKYIRENNKIKAYQLAQDFEELQYLEEFIALEREFNEIYDEAKSITYSGSIENLAEVFGDYTKISYWSDKIQSIFQIAYLEEFKQKAKLEKSLINWEQSVKNYIQIFGIDDDIITFCEMENLAYDFTQNTQENKQAFSFQKTLLSRVL